MGERELKKADLKTVRRTGGGVSIAGGEGRWERDGRVTSSVRLAQAPVDICIKGS